jgi:hypothetical protein
MKTESIQTMLFNMRPSTAGLREPAREAAAAGMLQPLHPLILRMKRTAIGIRAFLSARRRDRLAVRSFTSMSQHQLCDVLGHDLGLAEHRRRHPRKAAWQQFDIHPLM